MKNYISKEETLKIVDAEESWLSDTNHTAYDVEIAFHGLKKKIESIPSVDLNFLNFLVNVIPPNEMEKYRDMYNCLNEKEGE